MMETSPRIETLLVNAPVLTPDSETPDADALAMADDRIVAVGGVKDLQPLADAQTRVIDLGGRTVVPGLTDAHFHLVYYGMTSSWLDFSDSKTAQEMTDLVRTSTATKQSGAWIYGRGWNPAKLEGGRPPTLAALNEASPHHPVLLSRGDGHLCLANSEALRRAGIDQNTTDPPGGRIERDASGAPTGLLSEAALYLAWNAMMAELTPQDFRDPILRGAQAALSAGVTSVHAVLLENVEAELQAIRSLDESGDLPLRIYTMVAVESLTSLSRERIGWQGRMARVGAAKIFADGTLFAGTAALREPYADAPWSQGEMAHSQETLRDLVRQVRDAGLQPVVHAVGDRTVEAVLDAVETVYGGSDARTARPRIEHATVLAPDLVKRMKALGVVASLQSRRSAQLRTRLGKTRAAWTNPWRALRDADVPTIASSDAPFLQRTPGVWSAVTEAIRKGLTLEEALHAATGHSAYASFQEGDLGTLRPGMLADLTVLSSDPRLSSPKEMHSITPTMAMVDGRIAWEATSS